MSEHLRNRIIVFVSVIVVAFLFLLPTIFRSSWEMRWVSKPINLGLDLSGGVHLVYQVQTDEAVKSRLQSLGSGIRSELRKEKVAITHVGVNSRDELELTLLTSRMSDRVKKYVDDEYGTDLEFVGEDSSSKRPILRFGVSENWVKTLKRRTVAQAVETLRTRVDKFGVTEPLIQKSGQDRILLQMPGVSDVEAVKNIVGSVAKLEFRFLPSAETRLYQIMLKDRQGNPVAVEDELRMSGESVDSARWGRDDRGQIDVSLTLTSEGGRTFARITRENVGRNLAIILDGVVYSSPTIREPITGGRASISGGFTIDEANQLALVLESGALPAPLKVMEERTVGPTLGQESIENGIKAIVIGFALIIVFMLVYYKKAGAVAVGSLVLNLFLVLAALSAFGATLTLPGLAGLALTIGMAVDANVIIFERIREEVRNGSGRDAAVKAGFDRALSAIIDSNVTTLLAGLVLYYFGTGPIRGFAVTLCVGIITTIYCATFVSRLAFDALELRGSDGNVSI